MGILVRSVRYPPENDWHYVDICPVKGREGVHRWSNRADVSWTMYYVGDFEGSPRYAVGTDCPYYDPKYGNGEYRTAKLTLKEDNEHILQGPFNEDYTRVGPSTCSK